MKRLAILGATGSIGTQTLEVVAESPSEFEVAALSTHCRWREAAKAAHRVLPRLVAITDESIYQQVDRDAFPKTTELVWGARGIERIVNLPEVDVVVAAMVGAAGLRSVIAALEAGKDVALANKESLVVAGALVTELARKRGRKLLPIDSEHSAILQALQSGQNHEVQRIILTASGGPFRDRPLDSFDAISTEQALQHPTWNMGRKITIDSATMMNKSLEIIEARWLFDLRADQIAVLIHPQSYIHSMVEFVDGSVLAQLSPPDMRLPIQYALTWPNRRPCPNRKLKLEDLTAWEFALPDPKRFPALELGYRVVREGGTSGAVLNAANEVAVERFLAGDIRFPRIVSLCTDILDRHRLQTDPNLEDLFEMDRWARLEAARWKSAD